MGGYANIVKKVVVNAARSTAKLMKTNQTTSYRTGDDGDIEAGRDVDFFTLAENNPFGNTNRFTDELGGQTYTNNIVIDWSTYDGSTVLGWYRLQSFAMAWNDAIDGAMSISIGTFTSGWYLPNMLEMISIANFETTNGYFYNYAPFNVSSVLRFWTSTTSKVNTANAYAIITEVNQVVPVAKTNSSTYRHLAVRNFTVTGTTLT
jgi:hypothetical protein